MKKLLLFVPFLFNFCGVSILDPEPISKPYDGLYFNFKQDLIINNDSIIHRKYEDDFTTIKTTTPYTIIGFEYLETIAANQVFRSKYKLSIKDSLEIISSHEYEIKRDLYTSNLIGVIIDFNSDYPTDLYILKTNQ